MFRPRLATKCLSRSVMCDGSGEKRKLLCCTSGIQRRTICIKPFNERVREVIGLLDCLRSPKDGCEEEAYSSLLNVVSKRSQQICHVGRCVSIASLSHPCLTSDCASRGAVVRSPDSRQKAGFVSDW